MDDNRTMVEPSLETGEAAAIHKSAHLHTGRGGGGGGGGRGAEPEPGGPLDVFGLAVFLQRAAPIGADLVRTSLDESGPGLAEFSFACKSLQQSRRRVRTSLNESGPGLAEFSFACKSLQQQQS